jgi:hypothetical protein
MSTTKITLEIKTCADCPFCKQSRIYTGDSFELVYDWFCEKANQEGKNKKIADCVGWYEEKDVEIPNWCPIKS